MSTVEVPAPGRMLDLLSGFVHELRAAGLPVSMTENLDAMRALEYVPMGDRAAFKTALSATLVKHADHAKVFNILFDVYFALQPFDLDDDEDGSDGRPGGGVPVPGSMPGGGAGGDASPEALAAMLMRAILDPDTLRRFAAAAVARYAGMEPGRPVGGTYYLYRTLRALDLDSLLDRLMEQLSRERMETGQGGFADELEERLAREELAARIQRVREEVEAEIRRRLVADRGPEAMARSLRAKLPEDVEFMHASRDEMAALQRAIGPLARALAARLAMRRRRHHRGQLDFRATVRRSLSYGGVPAEPRFRRPHPSKPEIMVIADISGSVASFARFTLQLVHALASQFSRVRSFVFIDGIDEVTGFFEGNADLGDAVKRINTEADVVWVDGHSDYGHALEVFHQKWGNEVTPKTSVIILGDARNNYHATQAWVLAELRKTARHLYWIDPEPAAYWNTGDSVIGDYAPHCDGVYECRNLRQLESFVEAVIES
ncbi:MAG: uncharacterized protein QOE80_3961 [Actinomycetota bacterium]|nr:uncharacterized protein [Actinomycetota bacterium]